MSLIGADKTAIIEAHRRDSNDTGSPEVQVALLTQRIRYLTEHFKMYKNDLHSRYGLQRLVNRRRKLLKYLKRKYLQNYNDLIKKLGLRDSY